MNIRFFLFRAELLSNHSFDELRISFIHKIGMRFLKGNVEKEFVSLFYIFDFIFYQKMKIQRMPIMQLTIDKAETKFGKQVIRFKMANFAVLPLVGMIIGVNYIMNFEADLGPIPGIVVSTILYLISLGRFNQQLEQFKEELKSIERKLAEKKDDYLMGLEP